jgi:hypothetical protein
MAFTVTTQFETVMGNKRVTGLLVSADAASAAVDSQMGFVECVSFSPVSMGSASSLAYFYANQGVGATSIAGSIRAGGLTSGDVFFLTVYGR